RNNYFGLSGLNLDLGDSNQGRRASRLPLAFIFCAFGAGLPGATRSALAPGFHIPRLWRWLPEATRSALAPDFHISAPLALVTRGDALRACPGFHIPRLWRWLPGPSVRTLLKHFEF